MVKKYPQKESFQVGLNKEKIEDHLKSFKPSKKFERRRKAFIELSAESAAQERKDKEKADEYLEGALESLDEEEKQTYEETVSDAVRDILEEGTDEERLQGIRVQILRNIFTPEIFKEKYKEWQSEYETKSKTPGFDKSEEEFVIEKGRDFIVKNRNLIIEGRVQHRLDEIGDKEEDEEKEEERREKLSKEVFAFIEKHEENILNGEADVMMLRDQFLQIFYANGHEESEKLQIEQLFWEVIGDIEYASIMKQELEATAEEMIEMSYLDLTPEEWEKRRQQALKENAEGDLEEALEEMAQPAFAGGGLVSAAPEVNLSSVKDIENKNGVHLERVDIPGRYVYKIAFPHFKGRYQPYMEIHFSGGSKSLDDATYVIEDPNKDPGSGSRGEALRRSGEKVIPTFQYRARDVSTVFARMQLDQLLSEVTRESKDPGLTQEKVNSLLTDKDLRVMAEQLLGFTFQERPLLPPHMVKCRNLLMVLSRPDGRSFQERLKEMKLALNNPQLVPYLRKILSRPGSRVMLVSDIIEEAELERGGIEIR